MFWQTLGMAWNQQLGLGKECILDASKDGTANQWLKTMSSKKNAGRLTIHLLLVIKVIGQSLDYQSFARN